MRVEIVGFVCTRIEAMLRYRKVIDPTLSLTDVKVVIDTISDGHPVQVEIDKDDVEKLVDAGFGFSYPTQDEVKQLMNQLIQRFLGMGKKRYAQQLIAMWLDIQKEEDNAAL